MKKLFKLKWKQNSNYEERTLYEFESVDEFYEETREYAGDFFGENYEEINGKVYAVEYDSYDDGYGWESKNAFLSLEEAIKHLKIGTEIECYYGLVKAYWQDLREEGNTILATTSNGVVIYMDDETRSHMEAHSDMNMEHIREAITKIRFDGGFYIDEIDLGREIGLNHCVETTQNDTIYYAKRPNRNGESRFVVGREAEPTYKIVVGIYTDDSGVNKLFTSFYGILAEKEPWDTVSEEERIISLDFWSCHALVE